MAKRKLNVVIGKYDPRGSKVSKMTGLKSYLYIMQYAKDEMKPMDWTCNYVVDISIYIIKVAIYLNYLVNKHVNLTKTIFIYQKKVGYE